MNKSVGEIYETTNYDMFKPLEGNRNVSYSPKLESAAKEVGFLYQILVNEKYEVIDGQHRLEVCKRLNIPVRYEIKEGAGSKEVISLNTVSKKWTITDYITHFADKGNSEYQKLGEIIKQKLSSNSSVIGTALNQINQSGTANTIVKEGEFKFHDYEGYLDFVAYVKDFKNKTKIKMNEKLFGALYQMFVINNFDGYRFIAKLYETGEIERVPLINDIHKLIEIFIVDVNNHKLGTKSKNYINYTFSTDGEKRIIVTSDYKKWAKK